MAAAILLLSGCGTGKEPVSPTGGEEAAYTKTISASGIDTGGIEVTHVRAHLTNTYNDAVFAETLFDKDGFTIMLDSDFGDAVIGSASQYFGDNTEVSSPDATYSGIQFRAYDGNVHIGNFNCTKQENPFFYSFCDEYISVSGSWSYMGLVWLYDLRHDAGFGFHEKQTEDETTLFTSETNESGLVWTFSGTESRAIYL